MTPALSRSAAVLVLLACHFCTGCGLLYVPNVEKVPATTVRVVDMTTGQPITNARVRCFIDSISSSPEDAKAADTAFRPLDKPLDSFGEEQAVSDEGDGEFLLASKMLVGTYWIAFPLNLLYGPDIRHTEPPMYYNGHELTFVAEAPGFNPQYFHCSTSSRLDRVREFHLSRADGGCVK